MNDYQVRTDIYNGPMDLLLYLIRRDEIDLYDIPLAQVTQTYCEYVEMLQKIDPNIAGDFLVMAATLMEMKSRMLLPRPVMEEGEPEDLGDPRLELVRQLLEYKKFKDASFELGESAREQWMKWPRVPAKIKIKDANEVDIEDVQIWDLVGAFNKLMSSIGAGRSTHDVVFDDTPISLHAADVVDRIAGEGGEMLFEHIFTGRSKVEMIGLFLALLELMRQHRVRVVQHGVFGPIRITLLSTEPIQVGEEAESALSEAALGPEQARSDEVTTTSFGEVPSAGAEETASEDTGMDGSLVDEAAVPADDKPVAGEDEPRQRRAPRKHWKEPIAAFDIEKDELFSELEQIKTDFDVDAIIKESKERGRKQREERQPDANGGSDEAHQADSAGDGGDPEPIAEYAAEDSDAALSDPGTAAAPADAAVDATPTGETPTGAEDGGRVRTDESDAPSEAIDEGEQHNKPESEAP